MSDAFVARMKSMSLEDAVARVAEMLDEHPDMTGAQVLERLQQAVVEARAELNQRTDET